MTTIEAVWSSVARKALFIFELDAYSSEPDLDANLTTYVAQRLRGKEEDHLTAREKESSEEVHDWNQLKSSAPATGKTDQQA
jgi:hypothetical protein